MKFYLCRFLGTFFSMYLYLCIYWFQKTLYTWLLTAPLFATWGSLKFDISIASYTITAYLFFFSIFYYILLYRYTQGQHKWLIPTPTPIWRLRSKKLAYIQVYTVLGGIFLLQRERACPCVLRMGVRRTIRGFKPRELINTGNFIIPI